MEHTLEIGTISHGTLRNEDLASALIDAGDRFLRAQTIRDLRSVVADPDAADASRIINEAIDELQEFAPAYCYVGMHEGDGSDLGVWPDMDVIDMATHDGELLKVSDLSEIPDDWRGMVMAVNDHGNVTLYRPEIEWRECWAIV